MDDFRVWRNLEQYNTTEEAYRMLMLDNCTVEKIYWDLWVGNARHAAGCKLPFASDLYGSKSGPCIVVGAGPSLQKNARYLQRAYEQGFEFVVTDRALKPLRDMGIHEFIAVTTECQPECGDFLTEMKGGDKAAVNLISCASTRDALIERGCDVYNLATMVPGSNFNRLVMEEFWGEDHSCVRSGSIVGFIAVDLAFWIGYDPIYTIGNDLCYDDPFSCADDTAILPDEGNGYMRRLKDGRWTFPMFEQTAINFSSFMAWHPDRKFYDLSGGIMRWPQKRFEDVVGAGELPASNFLNERTVA